MSLQEAEARMLSRRQAYEQVNGKLATLATAGDMIHTVDACVPHFALYV